MSPAAWLPTALVAALLLAEPCSAILPHSLAPHRPALHGIAITAAADADPARRPVVVPKDSPSQPPGASLATSTINLVKGVIGSSVFALPAGVAAFASTRAALVPSFLLLGAVATLSGYTFWMIARVNEATDTDSFGGAWRATFGESTSWVPSAIIVAKCFASCLTYTMVIGDSFAPILGAAAAPAWLASRSGAILSILPLVVLPLCLLPSLSMLRYTSLFGVAALIYSAAFLVVRAAAAPPLAAAAATAAARSPLALAMTAKVFVLVSLLSTAFTAHYNAPRSMQSPRRRDRGRTVRRLLRWRRGGGRRRRRRRGRRFRRRRRAGCRRRRRRRYRHRRRRRAPPSKVRRMGLVTT